MLCIDLIKSIARYQVAFIHFIFPHIWTYREKKNAIVGYALTWQRANLIFAVPLQFSPLSWHLRKKSIPQHQRYKSRVNQIVKLSDFKTGEVCRSTETFLWSNSGKNIEYKNGWQIFNLKNTNQAVTNPNQSGRNDIERFIHQGESDSKTS